MRWRHAFWPVIFAACVVAAGVASIATGKDANWDLKNYHWYNAWALLNGRLGWDLAPAQIQTYLNPVGDLPFYFLVQWLPWPRHVAFWMALSTAVAAYVLIRLGASLFSPSPLARLSPSPLGEGRGGGGFSPSPLREGRGGGVPWIVLATAIGVTGAGGRATIGSTMNEWLSAAPLMAAIWLAVGAIAGGSDRNRRAFAMAGFLVGCAVGLKLTYAVFGVAFIAALASWGPWRGRMERVAIASAFAFTGFLLFGGYWAWVMWRDFGNPTFPFYNHVFQSPWWEPTAFFDRNWGPRNALQAIFFPLYFSHQSTLVSEVGFRDYRLAALLVLALICACVGFARRLVRPSPSPSVRPSPSPSGPWEVERGVGEGRGGGPPWRFLIVFTLVSYLAWLKLFGIYRYLVPLELLSGPLIVGCVLFALRGMKVRYAAVAILTVLLIGTTRPMSWGRIPFGHGYFEVKVPELAPNALVIMGYSHPMAYVIPFFRPDARFVTPASNFLLPEQGNRLAGRVAEVIGAHRGPIYLVEHRTREARDAATLRHFGLAFEASPCETIRTPMSDNFIQVCRVVRPAAR